MARHPLPRLFLFPLMAILPLLFQACKKDRYESPAFRVISRDGNCELREYPESLLVTTPSGQRAQNGAFMRLFRFISGNNDRSQKISMTTPVLMSGGEGGTMSFVVPKEVAGKGIPKPSDPSVTVTVMPAGRYASCCFSGYGEPKAWLKETEALSAWMNKQGIKAERTATPLRAVYNPPWTPGFLRRNEVLIRVSGP